MNGPGRTGKWTDRSEGNRKGNREWLGQVGPGNRMDSSEGTRKGNRMGNRKWVGQVGPGNRTDRSKGNGEWIKSNRVKWMREGIATVSNTDNSSDNLFVYRNGLARLRKIANLNLMTVSFCF